MKQLPIEDATVTNSAINTAVLFFETHAGTSYMPGKETKEQGQRRSALALARAEKIAQRKGFYAQWIIDNLDSSEWSDERPAWRQYVCLLFNAHKECIGSLCGIDFGRNGSPLGDPYARVIEAELALEAMQS